MSIKIALLGEVIAYVDGQVVDLGPPRQRCVLAVLAVDAGRLVAAGRVAGLDVRQGDTSDQIGIALARHRARVVDTELVSTMGPAEDGAVSWTVEYHEHGGFVATVTASGHDTGPRRGWGYAPTAMSAAAMVAGFSPHRRPVVVAVTPTFASTAVGEVLRGRVRHVRARATRG